jgi:hypothetical protein
MSHPRALLLGNRQSLCEIGTARFCRVDANLGQRIIDWIGGGVKDRAHCTLDEHQIAVGAGACRDGPHHVREVEDVDVLVDDDHAFAVRLGTEGGHDRLLRLALGGFSHLNDRHEGTTGDCRNVHGNDIGQVAAQRVEDLAFAGNAADQDVIRGGPEAIE